MRHKILFFFLFFAIGLNRDTLARPDVTVVGFAKFSNGIGRLSIGFIDCLKDALSLNFINTRFKDSSVDDIPEPVLSIMKKKNKTPGKIAILFDVLTLPKIPIYKSVPGQSYIKLAYSTVESTELPSHWPQILNKFFDAVIVPNPYLVDTYQKSGVKIPIFMLPLGLYLDELLAIPLKEETTQPFIFGVASSLAKYKNIHRLITAFNEEFGNNQNVMLKIQTTSQFNINAITKQIAETNTNNIVLNSKPLSWLEYIQFIASLNCYVLPSKGEGFSVPPYEAIAAGIPCILSNNTAHKTLCATGFVRPVESTIKEIHEGEFYGCSCGYNFNCTIKDLREALRDVYQNYRNYLSKTQAAREWVKQYAHAQMKPFFMNLIKPGNNIFLGTENKITRDGIVTNSVKLYLKYKNLWKIS